MIQSKWHFPFKVRIFNYDMHSLVILDVNNKIPFMLYLLLTNIKS